MQETHFICAADFQVLENDLFFQHMVAAVAVESLFSLDAALMQKSILSLLVTLKVLDGCSLCT